MHNVDRKVAHGPNAPYIQTLLNHPRVYLAKADERLPNAIVYPKDAMVEKHCPIIRGERRNFWFTSSLSWMIALAIEQKPEKIGIWGVDMAADEEYGDQRSGMHYFIEYADKQGIKIKVPYQSDLLQGRPLYGYKEFSPFWLKQKARHMEISERLAKAQQAHAQAQKEIDTFTGALEDVKYNDMTWWHDNERDDEVNETSAFVNPEEASKPVPEEGRDSAS